LFAEINGAGDGITKRLRHVTDDMKAYKQNRTYGEVDFEDLERKKAAAEARRLEKQAATNAQAQAVAAAAANAAKPTFTPQFALEGNKRWVVKHQVGTPAQQLTLEIASPLMHHAIHIHGCSNLLLLVKGKINSVTLVECKRVQVSLTSVVANVEIINCLNTDIQVAGTLPSASIESSHCTNVYLLDSAAARLAEIVTTASSTTNINFPDESDESEIVERALPEQFVTRLVPNGKGGFKLETKPTEIC
jgi:hypothetical protein